MAPVPGRFSSTTRSSNFKGQGVLLGKGGKINKSAVASTKKTKKSKHNNDDEDYSPGQSLADHAKQVAEEGLDADPGAEELAALEQSKKMQDEFNAMVRMKRLAAQQARDLRLQKRGRGVPVVTQVKADQNLQEDVGTQFTLSRKEQKVLCEKRNRLEQGPKEPKEPKAG